MTEPILTTLPSGERVLTDALGCVHPPRALVQAIAYLERQAAGCERRGYPSFAVWLRREADRRRVWLAALEATTEVPHAQP
jgi:hypothetical protein